MRQFEAKSAPNPHQGSAVQDIRSAAISIELRPPIRSKARVGPPWIAGWFLPPFQFGNTRFRGSSRSCFKRRELPFDFLLCGRGTRLFAPSGQVQTWPSLWVGLEPTTLRLTVGNSRLLPITSFSCSRNGVSAAFRRSAISAECCSLLHRVPGTLLAELAC